ncbi:hypothetical protein OH77DRAFT_1386918, partial [Trametes cingulata]
MIGARLLAEISRRLQQAKGEEGTLAQQPFGGINVIFTGDFGQLKPVMESSLYNHRLIHNPGLDTIRNELGVNNLRGIYLWRQVQTVVKLVRNQRQSEDPEYAALLARIRQVERNSPETMAEFSDAPIIVGTKALRDALNARIIAHKAREAGEEIALYYSRD